MDFSVNTANELSSISTEQRNPSSLNIDKADTLEILRIINEQDKTVAYAVEKELGQIALAVEAGLRSVKKNARVVYCGAGTSGRLGVLDASECPPTYGVPPSMFTGLIAGGYDALLRSIEGAEDDEKMGETALREIDFCKDDLLVGIAASGRTPYVIGAMKYAKKCGSTVVSLTCCQNSAMAGVADINIAPDTGPEAVTGSTRMKAGTAQKMVLNQISTGIMIKMGKVCGNLMVDVQPTNQKLVDRAKRIIAESTGCTYERAAELLELSGRRVKTAIVMGRANCGKEAAEELLDSKGGVISAIFAEDER